MKPFGRIATAEMREGRAFPFSNFTTALANPSWQLIGLIPVVPEPPILSVNAEVMCFACHRLI